MREKFFIVREMWAYRARYLIDKKKKVLLREEKIIKNILHVVLSLIFFFNV